MTLKHFFVYIVISALASVGFQILTWSTPLSPTVVSLFTAPLAMGAMLLTMRFRWLPKPSTDTITEDSREKILLEMAAGIGVIAIGLAGWHWLSGGLHYTAIFIGAIGFFVMLHAGSRFMVWWHAARENPALNDERVSGNTHKADRWGLLAGVEVATILGLLDYTDILPLSGAAVGFSAMISFILVGILANLWLEWKDG